MLSCCGTVNVAAPSETSITTREPVNALPSKYSSEWTSPVARLVEAQTVFDGAGSNGGLHHRLLFRQCQNRDRIAAEHIQSKHVLLTLRGKLREQSPRDLTFRGVGSPYGGSRAVFIASHESGVHAAAAVEQDDRLCSLPDALDSLFGAINTSNPDDQGQHTDGCQHAQHTIGYVGKSIDGEYGYRRIADGALAVVDQRHQGERQQQQRVRRGKRVHHARPHSTSQQRSANASSSA